MDFIRQRLVTLKCRARDLQTNLRRWAMYDEAVSSELKEDLLGLRTPGESGDFDTEVELAKPRLRPVSVQLDTVRRWYVFVLEKINERFEQASMLLDQGRAQECLTVLRDVETRMIAPNEETFGYVFRSLDQHTSHEHHLKLGCLDTILRDLYLSTVKTAHERSVVSKEAMSLTPIAYFTESSEPASWREHARRSMNGGRRLPLSMVGIPRNFVSHSHGEGQLMTQSVNRAFFGLDRNGLLNRSYLGLETTRNQTLPRRSPIIGYRPKTAPARVRTLAAKSTLGTVRISALSRRQN